MVCIYPHALLESGICVWCWVAFNGAVLLSQQAGTLPPGSTIHTAAYEAVLRALAWSEAEGHQGTQVYSRQQVVVRQVQGVYCVKARHLQVFCKEAQARLRAVQGRIHWLERTAHNPAEPLCWKQWDTAYKAQQKSEGYS